MGFALNYSLYPALINPILGERNRNMGDIYFSKDKNNKNFNIDPDSVTMELPDIDEFWRLKRRNWVKIKCPQPKGVRMSRTFSETPRQRARIRIPVLLSL